MHINDYLDHKQISKNQFARTIGISPVAFSRYCTGKRKPDCVALAKIELATQGQVTAKDFVDLPAAAGE